MVLDSSSYRLHPETGSVLELLGRAGWRQAILSNHVPELADIVKALGIATQFEAVLSSGNLGYEKPHPAIYRAALDRLKPLARVWMVGDNLVADALGARNAGISSILVRQPRKDFNLKAGDLWGAARIILGS